MAVNYEFIYAEIDLASGMCIGVFSRTREYDTSVYPQYIVIPEYNEEYIMKFYIDGAWYEDAEATIPWSPEN